MGRFFPNVTCLISFYTIKSFDHIFFNLVVNAKNWIFWATTYVFKSLEYNKVTGIFSFSTTPGGGSKQEGKKLPVEGELVNFSLITCGHMTMWLIYYWNLRCPPESCWRTSPHHLHVYFMNFPRDSGRIERSAWRSVQRPHAALRGELWETRSRDSCLCSSWLLTRWGRSVRLFVGCTCVTLVTHTVDYMQHIGSVLFFKCISSSSSSSML